MKGVNVMILFLSVILGPHRDKCRPSKVKRFESHRTSGDKVSHKDFLVRVKGSS